MTTETLDPIDNETYLYALLSLAKNLNEATEALVSFYQEYNTSLEIEGFIQFYCHWLGFIVGEKVTGDKLHIQQLIIDTIQQETDKGRTLCQLVKDHSCIEEDGIANELVTTYGLIIVPVFRTTQFISKALKVFLNPKTSTKPKKEFKNLLQEKTLEIFERAYETTLQEIVALKLPNPLIFLLENSSLIVGWLAGFFAQLSQRSPASFLENGLIILRNAIQINESKVGV